MLCVQTEGLSYRNVLVQIEKVSLVKILWGDASPGLRVSGQSELVDFLGHPSSLSSTSLSELLTKMQTAAALSTRNVINHQPCSVPPQIGREHMYVAVGPLEGHLFSWKTFRRACIYASIATDTGSALLCPTAHPPN